MLTSPKQNGHRNSSGLRVMTQHLPRLPMSLMALILSMPILCGNMAAANYFISPSGSDFNSGVTPTSPWKTFAFATPKLRPGDTLILMNGTYNSSTTGYLEISCGVTASNGTASQPITIRAENERQAFLDGLGLSFGVASAKVFHGEVGVTPVLKSDPDGEIK